MAERIYEEFGTMIDSHLLQLQRKALKEKSPTLEVTPLCTISTPSSNDEKRGVELIKEGKVATLILAGGQGTRLQFAGPKGTFPLTPVKKKTLFMWFSEKIKRASTCYETTIPLAIMTSDDNHDETEDYFEKNNFFDLPKESVSFFKQASLPFLDDEGTPIQSPSGIPLFGPAGNGEVFKSLFAAGIGKKWEEIGIEIIHVILIDNALADPVDCKLIGFLENSKIDIAVKAIERQSGDEPLGIFVEKDCQLQVVEYSEMDKEKMQEKDKEGKLLYRYGNISLFAIHLKAAKKAITLSLPLHKAYKEIPSLKKKGWKFETFIFDLFPLFSTKALLFPREETFSPLKNKTGAQSEESVASDLSHQAKKRLDELTKKKYLQAKELSPYYFYLKESEQKEIFSSPPQDSTYIPHPL